MLEILLIVAAWRRGWKAWALAPTGIALSLALMFGAGLGAALLFDLVAIVALIVMVTRPRTQEQIGKAPGAAGEVEGVR